MTEVKVSGVICSNEDKPIYEWMGMEATAPSDIMQALSEADGDDVTLLVNSGGGDLMAGNEIYSALKRYTGKTVAEITAYAASAATIICCGADVCKANPGIQYMIHNVSTGAAGDHNDMESMADVLKTADKSIANIYQQKTGLSVSDLLAMMDSGANNIGKWMDATEAKKFGFVDEIIGDNGSLAAPISIYNAFTPTLTDEVKAKIRREMASAAIERQKAEARLNLLRLKGGMRV